MNHPGLEGAQMEDAQELAAAVRERHAQRGQNIFDGPPAPKQPPTTGVEELIPDVD